MKKGLALACGAMTVFVSGCASMGGSPELIECLQPNRRVVVEVGGIKPKPPPKNKPNAKPGRQPVVLRALAQGNNAWDPGGAVLKDGGKAELDRLVNLAAKGTRRDKRATRIGSIIIVGHTDRLESADGQDGLAEARARAVRDYLIGKGLDGKLMFWEGKGSREPVPVTKFCEG